VAFSPIQFNQPNLVGVLGSLAFSVVKPGAPTIALRALQWFRDLESLGIRLPFFVVHDIGQLFAVPRENYAIGRRVENTSTGPWPRETQHQLQCQTYQALVQELASCEASRRAASLRLSDPMICVILSKLLGTLAARLTTRPTYGSDVVSDASLFDNLDDDLANLFGMRERSFEFEALRGVNQARLYVLTVADALDLDTLQLLGVLGTESATSATLLVDLIAAMSAAAAHDVVNFSLELLPSVLETKTRPGSSTRAGFGYSGLGTRGDIAELCLTELAWDADDFVRRITENEALYYVKEVEREPSGKRHILLMDASASMRGDRQVFARGLALATAKKLLLEGEDVTMGFFDARLYDRRPAHRGNLPTPFVLSFVGERGRNAGRVFSELITALNIEKVWDHRDIIVYVYTHAALYVPRDIVQTLSHLAKLNMVFILPSGGSLDLDYLDLLFSHHVVDFETIASRDARADKARDILGHVGQQTKGPSTGSSHGSPDGSSQCLRWVASSNGDRKDLA